MSIPEDRRRRHPKRGNLHSKIQYLLLHGGVEIEANSRKQQIWPDELEKFSYEDLQLFTDDFSKSNLVCEASFGKVYRGKIPEGYKGMHGNEVTVKTWEVPQLVLTNGVIKREPPCYNLLRFIQEISFITSPSIRDHPNMAKLTGYCSDDKHLGFVYNLKVSVVLQNFIPEGTLKWIDRIKIALGLARTLEYLHSLEPQYLVRDLSAFQILLDQELNPIFFDFASLTGGVIGQKPTALIKQFFGLYIHLDRNVIQSGVWTERTDVMAFGIILLELMCKVTVDTGKDGYRYLEDYARAMYCLPDYMGHPLTTFPLRKLNSGPPSEEKRFKFADPSFHEEPGYDASDDYALSKMARHSVSMNLDCRPDMRRVVKELLDLKVARSHGKELGA